jgi:hypothetical protein
MAVKVIPQTQDKVYSPQQLKELAADYQKTINDRKTFEWAVKKQQVIDIINEMLPRNFNLETKTAMIKRRDVEKAAKMDKESFADCLYEIFLSLEEEWHCCVGSSFLGSEYDEPYLFFQEWDDEPVKA